MHEVSVAESLLHIVLGQLAAHGLAEDESVSVVRLRIGVLAAVVPGALRSAFHTVAHDTILADAKLEIEPVPVTVWCEGCGCVKELPDPRYVRCPSCGRRTPDLRSGLELEVSSLEVL